MCKPNRDQPAQMSFGVSSCLKDVGCSASFVPAPMRPPFYSLSSKGAQPASFPRSPSCSKHSVELSQSNGLFSPLVLHTGLSDLPGLLHDLKFLSSGSTWKHIKVNFHKQGLALKKKNKTTMSVCVCVCARARMHVCVFSKDTHQLTLQYDPIQY